ncbi:MAG: 1,4-dihydroxy-2-naphthoate polyprenyltransferase [Microthrixaceae bacterium]
MGVGGTGRAAHTSEPGWRVWLLGARPRTLPAAVVPVLVGTAAAATPTTGHRGFELAVGSVSWGRAALAMVVALALQVGTNYANDLSDGRRGTDDPTKRVGPPRLVGNGLASADAVRWAMVSAFGTAVAAGFTLVLLVGWELVPVGVAAVAAGYLYTGGPRPYGYAGFGEAFVFVFFGVVATVGSTYVQTRAASALSLGASIGVGALATAMLVVNNLRDIPGDTASGKRTLAVRIGDPSTRVLYALLMLVPFVVLPFVAGLSGRPLGSLAFVAILVGTKPLQKVLGGARGRDLIDVLGATGRTQLVYGVLLAVGLFVLEGP